MAINFVLCNASLELFFGSKKFNQTKLTLLQEHIHNPRTSDDDPLARPETDEHLPSNRKRPNPSSRNWSEARPDILHFCLLSLHDSILNKEGRIQVYVQTLDGRLYKISKDFRVPRTFKVFNKVFANYLHSKSKTLNTESGEVLVERLEDALDSLIPQDAKRIAVDNKCPKLNADSLFRDLAGLMDSCWFFVSASPTRSLEGICRSNVVEVAEIHKKILARDSSHISSRDPNRLELLEESCMNYEHVVDEPCRFDHCLSFKEYNLSCLANCYALIGSLESVLGL